MPVSLLLQAQTQNIIIDSLRQAIKLHKEINLQSDKDIKRIELQFVVAISCSKRDFSELQVIESLARRIAWQNLTKTSLMNS